MNFIMASVATLTDQRFKSSPIPKINDVDLDEILKAEDDSTSGASTETEQAVRLGFCAQMYADSVTKNLTTPRKVKIYGYQSMTLNAVTKKNFKGVEFIAKTTPPESVKENKAVKQKAYIELYNLFKNDPLVGGQRYLREEVAKEVGMMDAGQRDKLFTADVQPAQPVQPKRRLRLHC